MMDVVFLYFLKATLCLFAFSMFYREFFSGLTHFQWMRFYLIASVALSMMLPLIQVPVHWYAPFFSFEAMTSTSGYFNFDTALLTGQSIASSVDTMAAQKAIAEMGYFDPQQVHIMPMPDTKARALEENGTVDIEFTVTEINPKK